MIRTHFDPGLLELQSRNAESVLLVRKLQTWAVVVMSKDREVLRQARAAVDGAGTVAGTESILTAHDNAEWLKSNSKPLAREPAIEPEALEASDIAKIARQ